MLLLNVLVFGAPPGRRSGLVFLLRTLHRLSVARAEDPGPPTEAEEYVGEGEGGGARAARTGWGTACWAST